MHALIDIKFIGMSSNKNLIALHFLHFIRMAFGIILPPVSSVWIRYRWRKGIPWLGIPINQYECVQCELAPDSRSPFDVDRLRHTFVCRLNFETLIRLPLGVLFAASVFVRHWIGVRITHTADRQFDTHWAINMRVLDVRTLFMINTPADCMFDPLRKSDCLNISLIQLKSLPIMCFFHDFYWTVRRMVKKKEQQKDAITNF